ncbi:MBOAT family O-acyltransferase [Ferrovibrio terrae]|uniref:MBOAT family O-acyltransferase n=1 Tax=Ferrovibrio terrae TaxID=2594003 RepID=UPI0031379D5B
MVFTSNEFLLLFLPIALAGFILLRRFSSNQGMVWYLLFISLIFYSWWNPLYVPLLLGSILFNYGLGRAVASGGLPPSSGLWLGVSANLAVLAWFKYSLFLSQAFEPITGFMLPHYDGELPLAISFFTFLQIAYVVDVCRTGKNEGRFSDYALFVVFFPHLIAGPLIHHKELIPQFVKIGRSWRVWQANVVVGMTIFGIGLFKKIGIADTVAPLSDVVFEMARGGADLTLIPAWIGAVAYALQIYFDFSGYSDMAIGLSLMFCLRLPINFNSPYQATSIIEFWKRWHMTLSRFLRDYLYIPLGGGRMGWPRRLLNLMIVMILGGLWHGAGWQFLLWGGLHGAYLVVNHGWRLALGSRQPDMAMPRFLGWAITFTAVIVAWVPFRAADLSTTLNLWASMAGLHGISVPGALRAVGEILPMVRIASADFHPFVILGGYDNLMVMGAALAIALWMPNVYRLIDRRSPALAVTGAPLPRPFALTWSPRVIFAVALMIVVGFCLVINGQGSPFLYFQF